MNVYRPLKLVEFTTYDESQLEGHLRQSADASTSDVDFTVRFVSLPPDCALVQFLPGRAIRFHVPMQFPTVERLTFYTNRWLFTAQMFAYVKGRHPHITGCCPLWLDDFPSGSGLAFCGNSVSHVLVPDATFLQNCGYEDLRKTLAEEWVEWQSRGDRVFWRGASTGDRRLLRVHSWQDIPRFRLCLLAKEFGGDAFDVGITTIVQIWDSQELDEIAKAGIRKDGVPLSQFAKYKYTIDIDGNTCSWSGLFTKLLMGNAILKVDSPNGFRQWYYDRLIPWRNFIPISSEMAELVEVAQWLRAHPAEAMEIAARGLDLANSLTIDRALEDITSTITDSMSYWPPHPEALSHSLTTYTSDADRKTDMSTTQVDAEAHLTQIETSSSGDLVQKVKCAFSRAWLGESDIDPEVLQITGMSGRKYRHFINNLVRSLDNATYLEVGSWMGSTLCSAINHNRVRATAIDNWSEFGGPKDLFLENVGRFRTDEAEVTFIESNFRQVDFVSLGKFDIYLFDGPHEFKDQYDGISLAREALKKQFVLVVDDWNWEAVRNGTLLSLQSLNMSVHYSMEIRTTLDNSHPLTANTESDWHNGYFIGVIEQADG